MPANDALRDLTDRYWEARLEASPLFATFLGDHRFDDQVDDLSEAGDAERRASWAGFLAEAEALGDEGLDETDRVSRRLLVEELGDAIATIDARLVELASDQMQGIHAELLTIAGQLRAAEPEHAAMAVARVRRLGDALDQAADRYRAGLAAGRTPARTCIDRSINQVDGYLRSPLDADPFAALAGPEGWDGEAAWREELRAAVADDLRPAFARYRDVLADELAPASRPDDRPGLCWIDGGEELYRQLIHLHTGLDLSPQELHDIGMEEVTEDLPPQYRVLGQRAFGTHDLGEIFEHLLSDADLRYRDADELLAHATACLDDASAAIGDWFGILPEAPCVLTPVPDFLAADAPAAYYTPPAPDGSRPGEYHVNLHDATGRGRAETASIAFHEAIPGHHLQLAIASERTDLPAFRRLSWGHTAYVEGWALYAERLAEEMHLYRTDVDRLGMLASDSWRACRLVVDTGLHALGWTRQQAIDFMVDHAPVSREEIETEIDRYIGMPGQALAYKVGQREILRLRAEAEARLGTAFSLPGFHDVVLGAATVSLAVLGERVRVWTGT
ncbi:MAG: DUF885 domain-containing protein [Acidimicrobiales bacterium]|nr:DUF885 domain-containing protein [Acidimicrobiales bacterium]HRW37291.1 DUF885 domain-containing protein [Aquihabitans sp.]